MEQCEAVWEHRVELDGDWVMIRVRCLKGTDHGEPHGGNLTQKSKRGETAWLTWESN